MVDIATITGSISGVVGVLREVVGLAKKAGSHELNEKVADLQTRILDIQTQLIELMNENRTLKERIAELERTAEIEKELVYEESVCWRTRDGKRIDGPLCPNCWDAQHKYVHLTPSGVKGEYNCGVCKQYGLRTADYRKPESRVLSSGGTDLSGF